MSTASSLRAAGMALLLAAVVTGQSASRSATAQMRPWGQIGDQPVQLVTLTNRDGAFCRITNLGATVTELWIPDQTGRLADVVLGFDRPEQYLEADLYFGCIAGRCANRIAGGAFTLDGVDYQLAQNHGDHHLHGGARGFDKVLWTVRKLWSDDGGAHLELRYTSPDGEQGYPGQLNVTVVYSFTNARELTVDMTATTDAATLVNLVHHGYWNLAGHSAGSILDHSVELRAAKYTVVDATLVPTGEIADVAGTLLDFTTERRLHEPIESLRHQKDAGHGGGFDVNYAVDGADGTLRTVALVYDPRSGRTLELQSDQPGLQFYTGNSLDGAIPGKGGARYQQYHGLCLESQLFPDAIHHPAFASPVLRPGETYRHRMVHRFGVRTK